MKTALPPFKHQQQAFDRFHDQPYGALFCEMGTGKTKIILDIIQNSDQKNILVIAPNGLHNNWDRIEIPAHLHKNCPYEVYCWKGTPTTKKARKELEAFLSPSDDPKFRFFLINTEALRSKKTFEWVEAFLKESRGSHMVIDESTCIKNPKAQQTKACLKLAKLTDRRWILNGTPITQGPLDVFAQSHFLSPTALPYRTYTAFKNTFAEETVINLQNRSFRKITGYRNLPMLTAQLAPFSLKLDKKDCLDLPEKTFVQRTVELTKEQERIYRDMRDLCLTQMEDGEIVSATMALTKLIKLHQILTGFVLDDEKTPHNIPNHRTDALLSITEQSGPTVIFCAYKQNVVQVKEALEEKYGQGSVVTYYGDTPKADRLEAVDRFQTGYADYFVGTSAAAKGITLHRASTMVYYSNSYSLETRLQSQDRIHRIGQQNKCTYIDLIAPQSLDEMIIKALLQKKDLADTVLDDLKELLSL